MQAFARHLILQEMYKQKPIFLYLVKHMEIEDEFHPSFFQMMVQRMAQILHQEINHHHMPGEVLAARIADHIDPVAAQDNPINRMVFSPDGFRLATAQAHDYTVRLWNGETLEPIAATQGHTDLVVGITFSHDGTRIASSSWDYSIRLWDGLTGEHLLALRATPVFRDVSPDTGRKNELRPARSRPRRAVFSSDDEQILSASEDGTVRRWRAHRSRSRPHRTGR